MEEHFTEIVASSSVVAVSLEKSASYFSNEISSEGNLRTDVSPLIVLPSSESGCANKHWIQEILKLQSEVRKYETAELIELKNGTFLDIGLLDIQVFFDGTQSHIHSILKQQPNFFLEENFKHIENKYNLVLHDQMSVITAIHTFKTDGEFQLHYHNVIFSLRREGCLTGVLSIPQLLKDLTVTDYNIGIIV